MMKNNPPECVLPSPDDYNALLEDLCNAELLRTAAKRLKHYDYADTIPIEKVAAQNGIDLNALPEENIELD